MTRLFKVLKQRDETIYNKFIESLYAIFEIFNGERFKRFRIVPYKYVERIKIWILELIDTKDR